MLVATVLLYVGLAGCSILAIALVMQYDLHRREPLSTIIATIGGGALAMFLCMVGQDAYVHAHSHDLELSDIWHWALMAGGSEETAKLGVVIAVAIVFRRDFDEPIDGLVYGAMAGLGAAIVESVHVQGAPMQLTTLPREEPIRLLGHLIMGGIGGFGVGLVARVSWRHLPIALACFVSAVVLHVTWDVLAYRMSDLADEGRTRHFGYTCVSIVIMLAGFFYFRLLVSVCPKPVGSPSAPAAATPGRPPPR